MPRKKPEERKPQEGQEKKEITYEELRSFEILKVGETANHAVWANLKINGVIINGCWVREGKEGKPDFISFPSQKKDDRYYPIAQIYLSPEDGQKIASAAFAKLDG